LIEVSAVEEDYSFSEEYWKMYSAIKDNNFKIDVQNKEFMFEMSETTDCAYGTYKQWNKLIKKIISI